MTFDLNDEIIGRIEFDQHRWSHPGINYDWADLSRDEKERWIEKAREHKRKADEDK